MKSLCVFLVIALFSSQALGFRLKRQAAQPQANLDDRYGWDKEPWQMQFPNPNQFPEEFPEQFPGLFPPGQGQFPGQGQRPGQNQQPQRTTATPATTSQSTTANDAAEATIAACIRACPVTPEYNPVCGSNNLDYENPGRLECAKFCGVNVTLMRTSRCPPATPAPQ